ncbi:MAG: hypothetical protein AAF938_08210 [Myxococcota bacterium]
MIYYALGSRFLAGVFDSKAALDKWFATVPEALSQQLTQHADIERTFPAFLIEAKGFTRATEDELRDLFATWRKTDGPRHGVYGNVYFFDGPWHPPRPGTDYMGVLPHIHIERSHVELVESLGLDALHESWLHPKSLAKIRLARA